MRKIKLAIIGGVLVCGLVFYQVCSSQRDRGYAQEIHACRVRMDTIVHKVHAKHHKLTTAEMANYTHYFTFELDVPRVMQQDSLLRRDYVVARDKMRSVIAQREREHYYFDKICDLLKR